MNHYRHITSRRGLGSFLPLCVALSVAPVSTAPGSSSPALRFVSVVGFRLGIAGTHWQRSARIAFSVREGPIVRGAQLRADKNGSFTIGINNIDMCAGPAFKAHDFAGHHVSLRGPALACPTRADPPVPRLRVLVSKAVTPQVTRIFGVQPRSVTIHVGDELYIWEAGTTRPSFRSHVPLAHLFLTKGGVTQPRACAQPDCDAGFYQQYAAVSVGKALIDMTPGCREVTPPCGLPDIAIGVTILPSSGSPITSRTLRGTEFAQLRVPRR